jgi:hypothetical protein
LFGIQSPMNSSTLTRHKFYMYVDEELQVRTLDFPEIKIIYLMTSEELVRAHFAFLISLCKQYNVSCLTWAVCIDMLIKKTPISSKALPQLQQARTDSRL